MQNPWIETEADYLQMMRDLNRIEFTLPEKRAEYRTEKEEKNEKVS